MEITYIIQSQAIGFNDFFSPNNTRRNPFAVENCTYSIDRDGGYSDFSAVITETNVKKGDSFYIISGSQNIFKYFGQILDIKTRPDSKIEIVGRCSVLDNIILNTDLGIIDQLDAFCIIREEIRKEISNSPFYAEVIDTLFTGIPSGVYISGISSKRKTAKEALDELSSKIKIPFAYGIKLNDAGKVQIYLSKLDMSNPKVEHLNTATSYSLKANGQDIPTVVRAVGSPTWKNILPNADFEAGSYDHRGTFSELGYLIQKTSNLSQNCIYLDSVGSAESVTVPSWISRALAGGASIKSTGNDGNTVLALEDSSVYETDTFSDKVIITTATSHEIKIIPGIDYTVSCWIKGEVNILPGNPPDARIRLEFLNNAGASLATYTGFQLANSTSYQVISARGLAPATSSRVRITLDVTSGAVSTNNQGVHWDRLRLYRTGRFTSDGWQIARWPGSSTNIFVNDYAFRPTAKALGLSNWKTRTGGSGFMFDIDIPSGSTGGNNFFSLFKPRQPISFVPGTQQRWMVHLSANDGDVANFPTSMRVRFVFYGKDGVYKSDYISPVISIVPPTNGFAKVSNTFDIPIDVAYGHFFFDILSKGKGVLDDLYIADARETSLTYYSSEVDISQDVASIIPQEPFLSYQSKYGKRVRQIDSPGGTVQDIIDYSKAWLTSQVLDVLSVETSRNAESDEELFPAMDRPYKINELEYIYPLEKVTISLSQQEPIISKFFQEKPYSLDEFVVGIESKTTKLLS